MAGWRPTRWSRSAARCCRFREWRNSCFRRSRNCCFSTRSCRACSAGTHLRRRARSSGRSRVRVRRSMREQMALYARLFARRGHVEAALGMMANWDLPGLEADLPRLATPLTLVAPGQRQVRRARGRGPHRRDRAECAGRPRSRARPPRARRGRRGHRRDHSCSDYSGGRQRIGHGTRGPARRAATRGIRYGSMNCTAPDRSRSSDSVSCIASTRSPNNCVSSAERA